MATLLLRLAAPLQAWGVDSKFEIRKTNREPTKSGVLGLLAAALGLRRDDEEGMRELGALRFAVRVDQEGGLLVDFHTANNPTPQQAAKARAAGKAPSAPYVTRRHYLTDAVFLVGLESGDERLLQRLESALRSPAFPLFLGRRSCPPTQPLCLGIRQTELLETLRIEPSLVPAWRKRSGSSCRIVADAGLQEAGVPVRDQPISFSPVHRRYGFRPVREYRADCPGDAQPETEHDPFSEWR